MLSLSFSVYTVVSLRRFFFAATFFASVAWIWHDDSSCPLTPALVIIYTGLCEKHSFYFGDLLFVKVCTISKAGRKKGLAGYIKRLSIGIRAGELATQKSSSVWIKAEGMDGLLNVSRV